MKTSRLIPLALSFSVLVLAVVIYFKYDAFGLGEAVSAIGRSGGADGKDSEVIPGRNDATPAKSIQRSATSNANESRPTTPDYANVKQVKPSKQSQALLGDVSNLNALYSDLISRELTLTGDELFVLREVLSACTVAAVVETSIAQTQGATQRVKSNPLRANAAEKLRRACADVPDAELSDARKSALVTELNRRDHPIIQAETLRAIAEMGFGTASHDKAVALLGNADPTVMARVADFFAFEIRLTGFSPSLRSQGLDVEHLASGFQLAACDMGGGCGPNSLNLLEVCVVLARCDVNSLSDYMRKYEPEKFVSADQFRQLVLASHRSGDWSWLNLPTLRAKLPA